MPYLVQDKFISPSLIEAAKATWPRHDDGRWHVYANGKRASKCANNLPRAAMLILEELASLWIAEGLQLNIPMFPDLDHLHGAGLHHMDVGTELGLHRDTDRHPLLPWKREASAIVYLDDHEQGGELDMLDGNNNLIGQIRPQAGRLVVFATPNQFHRVNECRAMRRSICMFYWSICDENFVGATQAQFESMKPR